jgi:hypothetical protein
MFLGAAWLNMLIVRGAIREQLPAVVVGMPRACSEAALT